MECSEIWFGYKTLSKDTGIEVKKLKKAMKELNYQMKTRSSIYTLRVMKVELLVLVGFYHNA